MTDTTPLITGVDFVCIPAQDFDEMTAFYGETLGLPFVKRYGSRPGAEYQAGNLTLAIMRTEDFGGTFSPNAMPIALQVGDVAVARERLEAKGVRFVSETFDSGVCWQAICLDPDGNPLSLAPPLRAEGRTPRRAVAGPGGKACLVGARSCLSELTTAASDETGSAPELRRRPGRCDGIRGNPIARRGSGSPHCTGRDVCASDGGVRS